MKIESLIKRPGGTEIDMDAPKRKYHFQQTAEDQRHIADVDVSHHAKALLRIKEGYRAVDDANFDDDEPEHDPDIRNLKGSAVHNAEYTILGGDTISLEDLINMAFEDSGLEESAWNDLADQERYEFIDATLKELQAGEHGDDEVKDAAVNDGAGNADEQPAAEAAAIAAEDSKSREDSGEHGDDQAPESKDLNANGINDSLENLTRAHLEPLYVEKFGRKPSSAMKVDDIKRALTEDDD